MENSKYMQLEAIIEPTHSLIASLNRHRLPVVLDSSLPNPTPQLSEALYGLCREDQGAHWGQGTEDLSEGILQGAQQTWSIAALQQGLVCRGRWNEKCTDIKAELARQANLQRAVRAVWNYKTDAVWKAADGREPVSPQLALGLI